MTTNLKPRPDAKRTAGSLHRDCSASEMSYDDAERYLKDNGWQATGHWDNWFHPKSGWNYSLWDAVKCQQSETQNAESSGGAERTL